MLGRGASMSPPGTGATSGHQKSSGDWPPVIATEAATEASGTLTPAADNWDTLGRAWLCSVRVSCTWRRLVVVVTGGAVGSGRGQP
jgi:hypothetical protein